MSQTSTVAFLESRSQAETVLKLPTRPEHLVPLAPEAAYALETRGISYTKAESLYEESDLSDRVDAVLDSQRDWASRVDEWIRFRRPDLGPEFQPARWHLFHLKRLFDALLFRAEVLRACGRTLQPAAALIFDHDRPLDSDWRMQPEGSLHARCTRLWARQEGINLTVLRPAGDERFCVPPRKRAFPSAAGLARRLRRQILLLAPGGSRRAAVYPDYDVAPSMTALRQRGFSLSSWNLILSRLPDAYEPLGTAPPTPLEEASAQPFWFEQAMPLGLDLSEAAAGAMAHWWCQTVPTSWAAYSAGRRALREKGVDAVVIPIADSPKETGLVRAARSEGIPVFIYQHGGFGGNCEYPGLEITDLDQADFMLFYGAGSAEHYGRRLRRYPGRHARPVPVGSARLDALQRRDRAPVQALRRRLRAGLSSTGRVVLYFPTMHAGYTRQLSLGEMPDVTHWELQRDIIRRISRVAGCRLVYRPFEGVFASPVPRLIAEEHSEVLIEREATLADLAESCDAVVCDIPSTGLLEVLSSPAALFVLSAAKSVRLTEEAAALLSRRAFVARTEEELLSGLGDWLDSGRHPADPADRSFLKAFGTFLDDGGSAGRAAAFVSEQAGK